MVSEGKRIIVVMSMMSMMLIWSMILLYGSEHSDSHTHTPSAFLLRHTLDFRSQFVKCFSKADPTAPGLSSPFLNHKAMGSAHATHKKGRHTFLESGARL